MSITFYIAIQVEGGTRYAYHCDCSQRWCDACDAAYAKGEEAPPMRTCEDCTDVEVNMANLNAVEWLRWMDLPAVPSGEIKAGDLAARCRRRLWDEARNHDPAISGRDRARTYGLEGGVGARVIFADRDEDYLRNQTARMLKVCEKAGDRLIAWA